MVTDILTAMSEAKTALNLEHNQPKSEFKKLDLNGTTSESTAETNSGSAKPSLKARLVGFYRRHPKLVIGGGAVLGLILVLLIALGTYTFIKVQSLKAQASEMQISAQAAYTNFKSQNLPATEAELKKLQEQETAFRQTYQQLKIYNYIPLARRYYQDGEHGLNAAEAAMRAGSKAIEAIAPYADVLGFTGIPVEANPEEPQTAENKLKVVLETLDKVTPMLDEIGQELETVQAELAEIDPDHYPEKLGGISPRQYVLQSHEYSQLAAETLVKYRPIFEQLPSIMGSTGERKKYLVLFQNDNELRPTGGFLTAYSVIYIEDGVVTPEKSDDIYELDQRFSERLPIPDALGRYLTTERYWHLRDMNIYPDFTESMAVFLEHYQGVRGEPDDINGIIAVDTEVLTKLLEVLGPVEVPGYGTFSAETDARCDCPQVVYALSEIITRPTPYLRDDRKGILGPMMSAILAKAYAAPNQQWPLLFETGIETIEGRHMQMYFLDEAAQQAAVAINAAGTMTQAENADFLAIVNANLGGAKSNLFIDYEVTQLIESAPVDGRLTKTIEITYRNSRKADNCNLEAGLLCLNSTLRDWTRLYLPEGTELIEAQGFTEEVAEYDENGFHIVDGFFTLEPLGQAKIVLTYSIPYSDQDTYRLKMWKQGGIDPIKTLFDVTGGQEELMVDQDVIYETPF